MLYERFAKPLIFFKMNPEKAHHVTIRGLRMVQRVPGAQSAMRMMYASPGAPELRQNLWGIDFPNPLGLAAGLDKNGEAAGSFSSIGFGFIEVGTVTPKAQPGNESPRLFRLPEDDALINRMGFNNEGTEAMLQHLSKLRSRPIPIAVNIGKNKITPNEQAVQDYRTCMSILYDVGNFFVVNISSPNTPNLRSLQHGDDLRNLLAGVIEERDRLAAERGQRGKAVLVKISPDLTEEETIHTVDIIRQSDISGIIATNTTITRPDLRNPHAKEIGGLSGKPLRNLALDKVRVIYRQTEGKIPIIGSGGIFTGDDAYEMIRAGASLVEIYTALIYKGPEVTRAINKRVLELLRRDGYRHISEAIGVDS